MSSIEQDKVIEKCEAVIDFCIKTLKHNVESLQVYRDAFKFYSVLTKITFYLAIGVLAIQLIPIMAKFLEWLTQ